MAIVIENKSTVLPKSIETEVCHKMALAIDLQVHRDFAPDWGLRPWHVRFGGGPVNTDPHHADIVATIEDDDPGVPGALAYHEDQGWPAAPDIKVLAVPTLTAFGVDPATATVADWLRYVAPALSHEVLETMGDPPCDYFAGPSPIDGHYHAREACDAVQADHYPIPLTDGGQVHVSNYLLLGWWRPGTRSFTDKLGTISEAFHIKPGGYSIVFDAGQATTVQGERPAYHGYRSRYRQFKHNILTLAAAALEGPPALQEE